MMNLKRKIQLLTAWILLLGCAMQLMGAVACFLVHPLFGWAYVLILGAQSVLCAKLFELSARPVYAAA